jgi:hypothetical protein
MNANKAPFETKDTNFGALIALIGILLILLSGTLLITRFLDRRLERSLSQREPPRSPMAQTHPLPPEPRLQVNPAVDLIRMRDVENVALNNYAWVDPDKSIVRIPITRAMEILAERGLPSRKAKR